MFEIERAIEIDAGHRVPFHQSGCRFLHGHRYRVSLCVASPDLVSAETERNDAGMVTDFGVLKTFLQEVVHAPFDHRLILWSKDPILFNRPLIQLLDEVGITGGIVVISCIPTAEELARMWGELLQQRCRTAGLQMTRCIVRETPNSFATWAPRHWAPTPLENLVLRG